MKNQILRFYSVEDLEKLPQLQTFSSMERLAMKAVAQVFPFRANNYVIENLIDWHNIPNDPIFRLTFPQPGMLAAEDLDKIIWLLENNSPKAQIQQIANSIRSRLNPHPSGQVEYNIPKLNGEPVQGIQHKYPQTVLIFPTAGQTCHSYCNFCFRWSQFIVGGDNFKFATRESGNFLEYLKQHQEVTDVLITGGDPMVMKAKLLALYIEPLLSPEFEHIQTIRIGTKTLAYWPYRFVSDEDADDILRLFERVVASGKHLAIMAHYDHWQEIETKIAQQAISRVRCTGAQIRTQAPLIRQINDTPEVWARMWQTQIKLGCVPYYMFVERDTGAKHYFEIPLIRAWEIFQAATQKVSGLARTVRGPVMSALPGKIIIDGVTEVLGEKVFVLSFIQGRNSDWCKRPFFARFDPQATWLSDLEPAFGEKAFFYSK
ncbi:MAG: hypothetical protein KME64_02750 [Scytonematopsis contorta HA4267-MV1]|nr:hypothetical protein [Scytonematopsis contorta HA4267-MV1]